MKVCTFIIICLILLKIYIPNKFILYNCIEKFLVVLFILWLSLYKHNSKFYNFSIVLVCIIIFFKDLKPLKIFYYLFILYGNANYYPQVGYNLFKDLGYPIKHNFSRLPDKNSILVLNYPSDMFEYFLNGVIPKKTCFVVSKRVKFCMNFIHQKELIFPNMRKKGNLLYISNQIKNKIDKLSILVYVESSVKKNKIKSGMFVISKNLEIPITPIFIGKIRNNIGYLPIVVGKTRIVKNIQKEVRKIGKFYKNNLRNFYGNKE